MSALEFSQLLGNYGEFVGAIAIVITLIYLSFQLRQNTRSINSNNSNNVMQGRGIALSQSMQTKHRVRLTKPIASDHCSP